MKKTGIIIIAVLFVSLGISFGLNLKQNAERSNARRYLLNQLNSCLIDSSRELDKIISFTEYDLTNDNTKTDTLMRISDSLIRADSLLTQYKYTAPSEALVYGAIPNFEDIARTMGFGAGTFNDVRIDYILQDNHISESEVLYLTALKDDIARLTDSMQSSENPPNENKNLAITQLNNILRAFFDVWSYHNEDSPYYLLRSE